MTGDWLRAVEELGYVGEAALRVLPGIAGEMCVEQQEYREVVNAVIERVWTVDLEINGLDCLFIFKSRHVAVLFI